MVEVVWSNDGKKIVVGNGGHAGEIGYRTVSSKNSQIAHGHGTPIQWLPDNRRVITGQSVETPLQAVDSQRMIRLGGLFPRFGDDHWLCIGADGHYRGSEGIESQIVFVALHKDGSQTMHTASDFQQKFGWDNDPEKATFLRLRRPTFVCGLAVSLRNTAGVDKGLHWLGLKAGRSRFRRERGRVCSWRSMTIDPIAHESTRLLCAAVNGTQTILDPQQMKNRTPNSNYGSHAFGIFKDVNGKKTHDFNAFLRRDAAV